MKVRHGFVSNSSSSSFCIYGLSLDSVDMSEAIKNLGLEETEDSYEDGENIADALELENHNVEDYYSYIGAEWASIGDDETGGEFKMRIENKLKKVFGDDIKCGTYEHAWYDG